MRRFAVLLYLRFILFSAFYLFALTSHPMPPRSGYTLPVFACAAAVAALQQLKHGRSPSSVSIELLEPPEIIEIAIEQVARLNSSMALAVTRSDPGDNLDITRNTPIWALVEWGVGDKRTKEAQGVEGTTPNYQLPITNYQLPITNYQLPRHQKISSLTVEKELDES